MLTAFSLTSCSGGGDGDSTPASKTVSYAGAYTVGSTSYSNLTLSGTESSGTATLSGTSGTLNGTYATGGASVRALTLSGTYTLSFEAGTVSVNFNGLNATFNAGSIAASGSGSGETGQTYFAVGVKRLSDTDGVYAFSTKQTAQSHSQVRSIKDKNDPSNNENNKYSCAIGDESDLKNPFTGDMYGRTEINTESDGTLKPLAEAVILSPDGTGMYLKQTNMDGSGSANEPGNLAVEFTYTTSGSTVTVTCTRSTETGYNGQTYTFTLGTDSLTWENKTFKKL